jgi:hypothetical protein|tara:strand:- start:505 stop:714 length:210 start_codon:yes stop_codon:yes gene_type:complete
MDLEKHIFDCITRVEAHEARCAERDKTIFARLEKIEAHLEQLNAKLFRGAVIIIAGMTTFIISILGPFN